MHLRKIIKLGIPHAVAALVLLTPAARVAAQGTDSLLTTVGTTVEIDGQHHAYILWQPGEAGATIGKRFSINRKDGPADATTNYQRVGMQTLHTSANTVRAMLELGTKTDRSHEIAARRIDGLYRDLTFNPGANPADPADSLDTASKLMHVIGSAVGDSQTLSQLFFLGRAHPGVMMSLGHAYQLPVSAGVHTFEIREVGIDDQDIRVVGRVTLDTSNPVELAAPTSPVRVWHPLDEGSQYTASGKDHLNARFRWGVPPTLLEQMPHAFGFDLFRVNSKTAEDLGWHINPPSWQEMLDALASTNPEDPNPAFSQVNELPILVEDMLTPAQAGDMDDQETIMYMDDGIWHIPGGGRAARRPFEDGEAFYYFVAARGITGQPGNLSPGTLAQMCDTLPPRPPVVDSVVSRFASPETAAQWEAEGQGGAQVLEVKLRQLPSAPAEDSAAGYYIYRWSNPQEYLNNLGNPEIGRIGYVEHQPGETFVTFDDDGPDAPTLETHEDTSVWYTARAVGLTRCSGEVLGGHSGPTPGFLRDFRAPDSPTGDFTICRRVPFAQYMDRKENGDDYDLPDDYVGMTIDVERLDGGIVAADVKVLWLIPSNRDGHILHSRRHVFQRSDTITVHLPYPLMRGDLEQMRVEVRGVTAHGLMSNPAVALSQQIQDPEPHTVFPFELRTEEVCRSIAEVDDSRPIHEAFDEDGSLNMIVGTIDWPEDQGVNEWRVYRRVGADGPLTLVAKAEGDTISSPAPWHDDALPAASGARVCYYAQVFDQNANPSPLYPIGCAEMVNPDLPTPMLGSVEVVDEEDGQMMVDIEWFCDPVGVERFEILIARDGGGAPEVDGLTELFPGDTLTIENDEYEDLQFYRFASARVGGLALGNGPSFVTRIALDASQTHRIAVRAAGPGDAFSRATGSASNVLGVRWVTPPTGPQPVIPWPARPVASTFDHRMPIVAYTRDEGPLWALSLPMEISSHATQILVGVTRDPIEDDRQGPLSFLETRRPPDESLFRVRSDSENADSLEELMPFMLYRYQVPSELFPDARPNLVQCTPLLDRISWRFIRTEEEEYFEIRDPYFRFYQLGSQENFELPVRGSWTDESPPELGEPSGSGQNTPPYLQRATGLVLLNDVLPVTLGAKYRHLIVQFDGRGEIKRVIPLDPIQH